MSGKEQFIFEASQARDVQRAGADQAYPNLLEQLPILNAERDDLPKTHGPKVYVVGQLDYDYTSHSRRRNVLAAQKRAGFGEGSNDLVPFLKKENQWLKALTWTVSIDEVPYYAIEPGTFDGERIYQDILENFKGDDMGLLAVSVAGIVKGKISLISGECIPVIRPHEVTFWRLADIVGDREDAENIARFLVRMLPSIRNYGLAVEDRAKNYGVTFSMIVTKLLNSHHVGKYFIESVGVQKSPIYPKGTECWDVTIKLFQASDLNKKQNFQVTVDVSTSTPMFISDILSWNSV